MYEYMHMKGIHKQTYGDQITEYIKSCILKGEFGPGDKINEVEIATRLKVSRAPVREALQHLSQTGLLISIPQKGKFIAALTAKEIKDSYFTSGVLEGAAVATTVHLFTEDDFATLEKLIDAMDNFAKSNASMEKIAALDDAFHECLFSRCDNELMGLLSRRSCRGISSFLLYRQWCRAFRADEMPGRHRTILDAVKSGDKAGIETTLREHYQDAGQRMALHGSDVAG